MKFLYYLPAIGNGNLDVKKNILLHNLDYIYKNIHETFCVSISFYDTSEEIKQCIQRLDYIERAYFYEKKGVLTELFLTNPINEHISSFDYILFVLDDVKIIHIDIPKMIEIKEKHDIRILSPKILKSTWWFMKTPKHLTIQNFLETYMLLLQPSDFLRFCSIHTIENKWMWGVDFLYGYYNIKAGVIHNYIASHELPSKNDKHGEPELLMEQYLQKHTKYSKLSQVSAEYTAIVQTIES